MFNLLKQNTQFMNSLEISILKDNILNFLAKNPQLYIDIDVIKKDLRLNTISLAVLFAYFNDMGEDDVIQFAQTKDGGSVRILEKGQKLLVEGGYTKIAKESEEERHIDHEKTKLEIQNLKLTKWLSIIAIILSVAAFVVSIFKK